MTGNEILTAAMALMSEEDREDYEPFALEVMNLLMAETAEVNNGLRLWHDKEPLTGIPAMKSLAEDCPCEEELCRLAYPYGLASKLLFEDGLASGRVAYLQNQYVAAINTNTKAMPKKVLDFYGGDNE